MVAKEFNVSNDTIKKVAYNFKGVEHRLEFSGEVDGVKYYNDTDFWVEPADFVRLKNITLGYTFPKKAFGGIFSNARLFVDAQNLFCITNYTGADPETDNSYSSYPNQRTFSFGIDLTF